MLFKATVGLRLEYYVQAQRPYWVRDSKMPEQVQPGLNADFNGWGKWDWPSLRGPRGALLKLGKNWSKIALKRTTTKQES